MYLIIAIESLPLYTLHMVEGQCFEQPVITHVDIRLDQILKSVKIPWVQSNFSCSAHLRLCPSLSPSLGPIPKTVAMFLHPVVIVWDKPLPFMFSNNSFFQRRGVILFWCESKIKGWVEEVVPPSSPYCPSHRIAPSCSQNVKRVGLRTGSTSKPISIAPWSKKQRNADSSGGTLIWALSSVLKGEFKQLFTGSANSSFSWFWYGLCHEGQSESELDLSSSTAPNFFYFNSQDFKWQNQHTT